MTRLACQTFDSMKLHCVSNDPIVIQPLEYGLESWMIWPKIDQGQRSLPSRKAAPRRARRDCQDKVAITCYYYNMLSSLDIIAKEGFKWIESSIQHSYVRTCSSGGVELASHGHMQNIETQLLVQMRESYFLCIPCGELPVETPWISQSNLGNSRTSCDLE